MAKRKRANKFKWWQIVLRIFGGILGFIFCFYCFSGIVNACVNTSRNKYAKSFDAVKYESRPELVKEDGYYTFRTDGEFKIMQLTDVHIGGGYWSAGKDRTTLKEVATMISEEKPDLVVVTGDLAYPVPFQAGTLNNKAAAKTFATLMEELGVYWTLCFGNHDTEAYSYFDRKEMYEFYTSGKFEHCLLSDVPSFVNDEGETVCVDGYGNGVIQIKSSSGDLKHAVILFDSHAYLPDDPWGVKWGYDYIKDNQIEWYEYEIKRLQNENPAVTSSAYFHIPLYEMRDAYHALKDAGVKTYENEGEDLSGRNITAEGYDGKINTITYFKGSFGENPKKDMVYSSDERVSLFNKMAELGSTKAVFTGHDHLNNLIVTVQSENGNEINLVYGMSVDNLAYIGITKYGRQRGCTVITVGADGEFDTDDIALKNYYKDFEGVSEKEKNKVKFDPMY